MKNKPLFQKKECTVNRGGSGQRRWIGTEEVYWDDGIDPGETFSVSLPARALCTDSPPLSRSTLVDSIKFCFKF